MFKDDFCVFHFLESSYKMKLFSCLFVASNAVPTVIWHGMGDYGNSSGMNRMKNLVLDNTENDYVLSLMIGDSE